MDRRSKITAARTRIHPARDERVSAYPIFSASSVAAPLCGAREVGDLQWSRRPSRAQRDCYRSLRKHWASFGRRLLPAANSVAVEVTRPCRWPCRDFRNDLYGPHPILVTSCAFTLLELMVAMSVLVILMLILLSMVEGATRLWRQNENRVDSYREARAALNMIASDMGSIYASTNTNFFQLDGLSSKITTPAPANMANNIFFLTALPSSAQDSSKGKSDLCAVGYFLAFGRTSQGQKDRSFNLYRFFLSSDLAFANITNSTGKDPFFSVSPTGTSANSPEVEVLARNITEFKVQAYTINKNAAGDPTLPPVKFDQTQAPVPDLLEITLTAVNQVAAGHFGDKQSEWQSTNSSTFKENAQTFTTRVMLAGAEAVKPAPSPTPSPAPQP